MRDARIFELLVRGTKVELIVSFIDCSVRTRECDPYQRQCNEKNQFLLIIVLMIFLHANFSSNNSQNKCTL